MRSFVRFCLDRPITTLTIHIILLLAGILSMQQIPLSAIPDFKRTRINVSVPYPNASPIQIENEVVRPLEEALATLRGVREIESESREGNGRVTLRFDYSTDIEAVKVEIRERLARAMDVLPVDDIERIRIRASNWGAGIDTIMEGRISAHGVDLSQNYDLLVNRIQRPIERIEGVGQVEIDGVSPLEVKISLRKEDLDRHGLTLWMITEVIQGSNIDATIGRVWKDGKVRRLRLISAMEDVEQLSQLPVNPNGLRLGQVATIKKIEGERRWGRHLNGAYAVSLEIAQESGANTVEVCRAIRNKVEEISNDPQLEGIDLLVWQDQGKMIVDSLTRLRDAGIIGGGLAVMILLLFLRRISATLLVGMAIPISVLFALAVLHLLEMELNVVTILALMLGVGMLVDTAVVVVESIVRRAGLGDDSKTAATQGTMEVATPVFASTLTTVVVFLPVLISDRNEFTEHLASVGTVISLTIVASLFVSLTLVPMVAARIYRGGDPGIGSWFSGFRSGYDKFLALVLEHRAVALLVALTATLSIAIPFNNGFRIDLSDTDWKKNYANINFRPVKGLTYQEMEKIVTNFETILEA
ncbi:MAG: efflux RND transporter permease subunit, partial [Planctomycetota bacterium]